LYHTCPGITIKNSGIAFVKMEKNGEVIAYLKFNNMGKTWQFSIENN